MVGKKQNFLLFLVRSLRHYVEVSKLFSVQISSMSGRSIVAYSTKKLDFWRATLANLVFVRVANIVRIAKLARHARFILT